MKVPLTILSTFRLWLPLTAMWMLMALEQPLMHGVIARHSDPTLNLAAYGYSFFSMLIFESPVFMLISASNALVRGPKSFDSFRKYAYPICILLTALMMIFSLTGGFLYLSREIIGLSEELSLLSDRCFLWLSPCPMMVGYRRFHQGLLVRARESSWLAVGSVIRLISDLCCAIPIAILFSYAGAEVACLALSFAVTIEAYFIRWRTSKIDYTTMNGHEEDSPLTVRRMNAFYFPLALSSMAMIGTQPLLTIFIARAHDAEMSLATWPVISSFIWLFASGILALHEIIIAHREECKENRKTLTTFATLIFVVVTALCATLLLTPLYNLWFQRIIGLSPEIAQFMSGTILLCLLYPALNLWHAWLKAGHTLSHTTRYISAASFIELFTLGVVTGTLYLSTNLSGITFAILGALSARLASCIYLQWSERIPLPIH